MKAIPACGETSDSQRANTPPRTPVNAGCGKASRLTGATGGAAALRRAGGAAPPSGRGGSGAERGGAGRARARASGGAVFTFRRPLHVAAERRAPIGQGGRWPRPGAGYALPGARREGPPAELSRRGADTHRGPGCSGSG